MRSVMAFGDIHFPFHHFKSLKKAIDLVSVIKPKVLIQVGDLYDLFAFSKYPRSLNVSTPEAELTAGRDCAEWFWREVKKKAPQAECYQLTGNHDERMLKRTVEALPAAEHLVKGSIRQLMTFKGVNTIHDGQEELFIDGICYQHGFRKFGDHARWNQVSTVTGHTHRGGVLFNTNVHGTYFELNAGWLGDSDSPVFSYRSQKRINGTTRGFGVVDDLGPRFVPLE